MSDAPKVGTICWTDLTVEDAEGVRDFYQGVIGWKTEGCDMGGYEDYSMVAPSTGETVAGVCHARGPNTDIPAQWLVYVIVEDLDASAAKCTELGGEVLTGPRPMGKARLCVVRDPAGAVLGLYQEG